MNKGLYTEKEWEEIVEYAFSEEAPDPVFSEGYKRRRAAVIASAGRKRKNVKLSAVITAAIAAALMIPAAAVAADRLYRSYLERTAEYEVELNVIQSEAVESGNEFMSLNIGYVPEGMVYNEDGPYAGKYKDSSDPEGEKGITPCFYRINDPESFHESVRYTAAEQSFIAKSGAEAHIIERYKGYDRLWVFFPDTSYAALIYVNGFDTEEIKKIADGLSLVPSDTETAGIWRPAEVSYAPVNSSANEGSADTSKMNLCSVGDTFDWGNGVEVTLDSITVQDNFEGIDTDCIGRPEDYSGYLDENGIISDERILIKYGDGVNSLDSEVSREAVTRKVIVMELTGRNTSETERGLWICPKMFLVSDGKTESPSHYDDCFYSYTVTDHLDTDDTAFSYYAASDKCHKNSVNISPDESVKIRLAFIADSDRLDGLYFDMRQSDGYVDHSIANGDPILKLSDNLS